MPHDIDKTSNFANEYSRLNLRYKRLVDKALEIIKETPTEYQTLITQISKRKDGGLYRLRMPSCFLLYAVPTHKLNEYTTITLLNVKKM